MLENLTFYLILVIITVLLVMLAKKNKSCISGFAGPGRSGHQFHSRHA